MEEVKIINKMVQQVLDEDVIKDIGKVIESYKKDVNTTIKAILMLKKLKEEINKGKK